MNTAEGAVGQHEPSPETFCKLDTNLARLWGDYYYTNLTKWLFFQRNSSNFTSETDVNSTVEQSVASRGRYFPFIKSLFLIHLHSKI